MPSLALVEQIRPIDKRDILNRIGEVKDAKLAEVEQGIRDWMSLDSNRQSDRSNQSNQSDYSDHRNGE